MRNTGRRTRGGRLGRICAAYCLAALTAALGWLYSSLPDHISLEPGQALALPRFAYIQPMGGSGARNVASTRTAGSYQATLSIGGVLPVKTVRAVITPRPSVRVCGTPFGVKMFSEGALVVGFTDLNGPDGAPANPAKEAGLRLGDRVICIGDTATESNDAVKAALEQAGGQPVRVVYVRDGSQQQTLLTPCWDETAQEWRAGMWVRDSSAGVGTLTFIDEENGVFAGLGHSISDGDTGQSIALRSGEIVPCEIIGCTQGAAGSPGELKGKFIGSHAVGTIEINGDHPHQLCRPVHGGGLCTGGGGGPRPDPDHHPGPDRPAVRCGDRKGHRRRAGPQYGHPCDRPGPAGRDRGPSCRMAGWPGR